VSWEQALEHAGKKLRELRDTRGGKSIGVIGGNRLTNEEATCCRSSRARCWHEQHRPPPHGRLRHVCAGPGWDDGKDGFST
jgi:hypothetical protein